MKTITFTTRSAADLVRTFLGQKFPNTSFDVRIDRPVEPFGPSLELVGLVVSWSEGADRDSVETEVSRYQGLSWDPKTGVLEEIEHLHVTVDGQLQRLNYGIDYILCDGPDVSVVG